MVLALLLAAAGGASAADWPMYGKDLANSRDGGAAGPGADKVAGLTQAWRFDTSDGDITGTPVVARGTLVVGSHGGSVFALDSVTGKQRWVHDVNEPINGTAAIAADPSAPHGGLVYVPIAKNDAPHLLALGFDDGAVVWDTVLTSQATATVFGSPVVWNGTVYMGTSADSGDNSTSRGVVDALDAKTGAVKWSTFIVPPGHDGGSVWSTPAIDTATGRVFVGTGNAYHDPAADTTDAIVALDAATGSILAHFQATPGDVFSSNDNPAGPDADFGASPNLLTGANGRALVGDGQKSGVYWAFDRTTLKDVWHTTIGPASPAGGIVGSTASDGTRVYGPNTPGAELWSLDLTGTMAWTTTEGGPANFAPVSVANGVVWTTGFSGMLTAADAASGQVLTKLPLGAPSFGGVAIVGGAVYAAVGTSMSGSGAVVAFGDTSGSAAPPAPGPGPRPGGSHAPRLRMSVRPRTARVGHRTRFVFRVTTAKSAPVRGAKIRFAGHRVLTGATGRATIVTRLHRVRRYRASAGKRGFRGARGGVRATR